MTPSTTTAAADPARSAGADGLMRIGELARRTGVSEHVLRIWERRYGLLEPVRTASGYRAYSPVDEARVRAVATLRSHGVSAADAAQRVLAAERAEDPQRPRHDASATAAADAAGDAHAHGHAPARDGSATALVDELLDATLRFDEARAQGVLDRAFTAYPPETLVPHVLLPFLTRLGEAWAEGRASVAAEHFASSLLRRRLATQTLTWGQGTGPLAVLACSPGERHDLPTLLFGVLLARVGWRVRHLGADTPVDTLAAASADAEAVVVAGVLPGPFLAAGPGLRELAAIGRRVVLAGAGATPEVVDRLGLPRLPDDMNAAITTLTELAR